VFSVSKFIYYPTFSIQSTFIQVSICFENLEFGIVGLVSLNVLQISSKYYGRCYNITKNITFMYGVCRLKVIEFMLVNVCNQGLLYCVSIFLYQLTKRSNGRYLSTKNIYFTLLLFQKLKSFYTHFTMPNTETP